MKPARVPPDGVASERRRLCVLAACLPVFGLGTRAIGAVAPQSKPWVFVLNSLDASVSVIDSSSWREVKRLPVGKEPHHLYLTPDDRHLLVANSVGDSLTFIDPITAQVRRELTGIPDPYQLRFSPDMQWFVTLGNRLDHVDVYRWLGEGATQALKLVKRIPTGRTPSHQWIDSRSQTVYATMQESDELVAIDLAGQTIRWRARTGRQPADVYLTADDATLFVALTGDRYVEVYDVGQGPARLIRRIETGDSAHAFRALGDRRHVFVSNRVANTISVLDTLSMRVISELPGPGGPDCMELCGDGRTLLVSSRWIRKLSIIDVPTRKLLAQVDVGRSPHGVFQLGHAPRQ